MPTALIVEDEPEANRLLALLIELRGYRTDSAYTGGEALEKVRRHPPDLVFLDLMLPDLNGYEVCETLKTRKATSLIPVIVVTARIAAENRIRSFRAGADDYIPKPYTPDQIFQAIDDADSRRRDIEGHATEGEIRLDVRSDGEPLRQLAQLRSLLVARSPLDLDAVCRLDAALAEIVAGAHAWGQRHGVDLVATLAYQIQDDRITLTLRDVAGWLGDEPLSPEERWPRALVPARFDEVRTDEGPHRVTFVKRFPSADAPPTG